MWPVCVHFCLCVYVCVRVHASQRASVILHAYLAFACCDFVNFVLVSMFQYCMCVFVYLCLCEHLCLWYWRAVWEWAVCHLAANALALPRHVLPNRWTKRATMKKQSVHDIRTHAFTKPTTQHQSFSPLTTAVHCKTHPYSQINVHECCDKNCGLLW